MLLQRLAWLWLPVSFQLSQLTAVCSAKQLSIHTASDGASTEDPPLQQEPQQGESDGLELELSNPDTAQSDGLELELSNPDTAQSDGLELELSNPDTAQSDGLELELSNPDTAQSDGLELELSNPDTAQNDGPELELSDPDTAQSDGLELELSDPDTAQSDGLELELSDPDTAQSDGPELELSNPDTAQSDGLELELSDPDTAQNDGPELELSNLDTTKINVSRGHESDVDISSTETDNDGEYQTNSYYPEIVKNGESEPNFEHIRTDENAETNVNISMAGTDEYGDSDSFHGNLKAGDSEYTRVIATQFTVATHSVGPQKWIPYSWDKGKQTAPDFLLFVCPNPCSLFEESDNIAVKNDSDQSGPEAEIVENFLTGNKDLRRFTICRNFACFPCDCARDIERAAWDNTLEGNGEDQEEDNSKLCIMGNCCSKGQFRTDSPYSSGRYTGYTAQRHNMLYAVVRCPQESTDPGLQRACENGKGEFTIDEPVTDPTTRIVYRNKACAECHGVNSFTPWPLQIACAHFQLFYMVKSEQELLHRIKGTGLCRVNHIPPSDVVQPESIAFFSSSYDHTDTVIRTCNVTGLWAEFDMDVHSGCAMYTALVFRVRVNSTHYTNLFCAICNGFEPKWQGCSSGKIINENLAPKISLPLTFLLGLKNRREVYDGSTKGCPLGQWLDFDNVCRNLSCSAGKSLNLENRTCSTAVKMIRGLLYELDVSLVPQGALRLAPTHLSTSALERAVVHVFQNKTQGLIAQFSVAVQVHTVPYRGSASNLRLVSVVRVDVSGNITGSFHSERDEVEGELTDNLLLHQWEVIVEYVGRVVFTPVPFDHDDEMSQSSVTYSEQFETEDLDLIANVSMPPTQGIELTRLLTCAFVNFGAQAHQFGNPAQIDQHKKIVLMKRKLLLADLRFSWMIDENGSLHVCADRLEEVITGKEARSSSLWLYALSMAVLPLSLLCLLLVLIVYALLPALRTQPGLNTMGTCTTLLTAQLTLILASHRVFSGLWCTALGILVHVSWLSTFCWTSVNSFHMFRAFSSTNDMRSGAGSYRILAVNTAVTLLVPGAVVAIVMGLSWHRSGGQSIGYSSSTCYLDSTVMVGLSVVLPLSLIVALNLLLYMVTVYRIHKVCSLQARAESETDGGQQHVRACLRLSLLTGTTWLLSLVAEGLDLSWLRVLAILTNGGQGALLLLSYVTRRRVIVMLAVRLGWQGDFTSTSTNSTMAGSKTRLGNHDLEN